LKQVGITVKQQGTNANILERYSSFTRKENKPLFKIKASKKVETPLYILLKKINVFF